MFRPWPADTTCHLEVGMGFFKGQTPCAVAKGTQHTARGLSVKRPTCGQTVHSGSFHRQTGSSQNSSSLLLCRKGGKSNPSTRNTTEPSWLRECQKLETSGKLGQLRERQQLRRDEQGVLCAPLSTSRQQLDGDYMS